MKRYFSTCLLLLFSVVSYAQFELFGTDSSVKSHSGFIINANGSADLPLADMAKRFSNSYRIGFSGTYKTKSNWLFGASCDFIVGSNIKEDSFMINIKDKYSGDFNGKTVQFINVEGYRTGVPVYERGYMIGVQAGKIINFNPAKPDNGLMLMTTVGFMQHKINIYNKEKDVAQLRDNFMKGYDRLSNGVFLEQYVGYAYFAQNGLLNFNFGLDVAWGFTQGRRDYLYDVMHTDVKKRNDILLGVRAGWMIPIFSRKSEDLSFE